MAILLFSVVSKVLPSSGLYDASAGFSLVGWLRHMILPAGVLAFVMLPNRCASHARRCWRSLAWTICALPAPKAWESAV